MSGALLLLADGTSYEGSGVGPDGISYGEAVFYTGMTGYEEALTDPSYCGQLLVFTYPLIGNYGVDPSVRQHKRICAAAMVCRRISPYPSHYRSIASLSDWLEESGVRAIEGVDTRALVTRLREAGTMRALLAVGDQAIEAAPGKIGTYADAPLSTPSLVAAVSARRRRKRGRGKTRIALIDCGAKENIPRLLATEDTEIVEVPHSASFAQLHALSPAGIVVSNGPGDPTEMTGVITTLKEAIDYGKLPILGICFGHQLLALAFGAKTYKMKYGHRGGNQPVRCKDSGNVIITAHNHGYAVDAASLPADLQETMINLNDGTNEGLRHRSLPVSSVQFHPEAAPGPADARHVLDEFIERVKA